MIELIRTNDAVLLSFVSTLLKEAGINHFVADTHMSIIEGSIGALSKRLLVDEDAKNEARQLLIDAGLADELRI